MAIEIAELIKELRAELEQAAEAGRNAHVAFDVGPVEVELTVAVAKEVTPNAKVKFWVVEAGSGAKMSANSTQKLKLTLEPRLREQPGRKLSISGEALDGELPGPPP